MRLTNLLATMATLFGSVRSQEALLALAKHMPKCSLACFESEIPKSTCAINLTSECMCTNVALNAAISACSMKTCTVYELLVTKNVSNNGCGVPVRDKGHEFIAIGFTGILVAVLAFLLRLSASLPKNGRQMSWDDATMGVVVGLSIPPAVFAYYLEKNGLGRDMWTLQANQITNVLHFYFAGEIFYVLALGVSKISILCFYLRVFPHKDFRRIIYGVMGLSVAYTIAFFFATTFQCTPVSYAWTQWDGLHEGTCSDIHLQGWIAAGVNIVLDAIVMVLPLKHLAGLNMNLKRKLMVMAMFSVGIIVIVISALRLYTLAYFAKSQNITWDYFEAGYWSLLEIDVSIICGCMPAHRLLVSRLWPMIKLTFHTGKSNSAKSSAFSGGSKASTTGYNKAINISIKPKTSDDGDFVPLVDMEAGNTQLSTTTERDSGHNQAHQDPHTFAGRSQHTSDSGPDLSISNHDFDSWPMPHATKSREHI